LDLHSSKGQPALRARMPKASAVGVQRTSMGMFSSVGAVVGAGVGEVDRAAAALGKRAAAATAALAGGESAMRRSDTAEEAAMLLRTLTGTHRHQEQQ
jgi:hypothetical protein